jgi:predicted secreted protein
MTNHSFVNETLQVILDQEFHINLKSTPSTGYIWEISELPGGINPLGSFIDQQQHESTAGGSSTQVFRFTASLSGEFKISFALKRSWESEATQNHIILVQVKSGH